MISPLPTTPWPFASRRNATCCNVLEKYAHYCLIVCQKVPRLPDNKRRKLKYDKLPVKLIIMTPWEALCVNLIGPYTLKGKDGSQIDFMCLTMINPASSWFEMVELPVMEFITPSASSKKGTKTHKTKITTKGDYFGKTSTMISHLINKTWFSRYPCCQNIIHDNGSEFKLHF